MQRRDKRRLILTVNVVRVFIKGLASYKPKVLFRVSKTVFLESCVFSQGGKWTRVKSVYPVLKSITVWFSLLSDLRTNDNVPCGSG